MFGLLQASLYSEEKKNAFISVYSDASGREQLLMRGVLANALKDSPKIVSSHGYDWILCTLASHQKAAEETTRVFQAIVNKINRISYGMLTEHPKIKNQLDWREMNDVADTCLVNLGFFKQKIDAMHKRKGAPSVSYYMKVGSIAFQRIGFENIGLEFEEWADFIENELAVTSMA